MIFRAESFVGVRLQRNQEIDRGPPAQRGATLCAQMKSASLMDALSMAPSVRVLLVEDSKVLAERLTETIDQIADVRLIGTAETEAAAIALVAREPVDVIILDLHLRQGTGFGVMRALAITQLKPQIIVLTNYDLPEYQNAAFALGATHFLDKARDCGRLPELLHEISEAHHSKH
jgi:two-component system, OmpR family, response regulator